MTAYDLETATFIRNAKTASVDSYCDKVEKNEDGSVDVYFSPAPPKGKESNWIQTVPDKPWFTFFRFYGPEKSVFDKTWVLDDIRLVE